MHPVAEQLQALSEQVAFGLALPDDDDLLNVEEALLLPIRGAHREFLLTTGNVVYGKIEPAVAADASAHNYIPEITSQAWEQGLPRDLIVVAEFAGGYYVISQEGEVGYWQTGRFAEESWEDIWVWAEEIWLDL